jgi:hypothetical protein
MNADPFTLTTGEVVGCGAWVVFIKGGTHQEHWPRHVEASMSCRAIEPLTDRSVSLDTLRSLRSRLGDLHEDDEVPIMIIDDLEGWGPLPLPHRRQARVA